MTRSWSIRDFSDLRNIGQRNTNTTRNIQRPATPTGISERRSITRSIYPRPSNSLAEREVKRHANFKKKLQQRYDTDELKRRTGLTFGQHRSHTGKIGSEGFRKHTTVKGIPYARDRSPHNRYLGKRRQYAQQNEFYHSNKHRYAAAGEQVSPFRWKRDDGADRGTDKNHNLTAFNFRKKQRAVSRVTQIG